VQMLLEPSQRSGRASAAPGLDQPERRLSRADAMTSKLVGFDVRIVDREILAGAWLAERRENFLLRHNAPWVASVDPVVWPSIFSFEGEADVSRRFRAIRVTPQDARQQAFGLWRDLRSMLEVLSTQPSEGSILSIPVAVSLLSEQIPSVEPPWAEVFSEPTIPTAVEDSWRLLGFDVADRFLMSGLSNCAYAPTEKETLSAVWSMKLSELGLIRNLEDASAFRAATDRRVQEHSPFFVFGLYALGGSGLALLC
jgi:hypothetical protein